MDYITSQEIFCRRPDLLKSPIILKLIEDLRAIPIMTKVTADDLKNSRSRSWCSDVELSLPQYCCVSTDRHYVSYKLVHGVGLVVDVEKIIARFLSNLDSKIYSNLISRFKKARRRPLKDLANQLDISPNIYRAQHIPGSNINIATLIEDLNTLSKFSTEKITNSDKAFKMTELLLTKMVDKYQPILR